MATLNFLKDLKIEKKSARNFVKIFNKKPRKISSQESKFVNIYEYENLLKALKK